MNINDRYPNSADLPVPLRAFGHSGFVDRISGLSRIFRYGGRVYADRVL